MKTSSITGLILTFDEAANLRRVLDRLRWLERVIVVDSGSGDHSASIAAGFANVRWHVRTFDTHTHQWNYGLSLVESEWVLSLDADYVCPESLPEEIQMLDQEADVHFCRFRYLVFGKPLRSTIYPPRPVLFRPTQCKYVQDGHTQELCIADRKSGFLAARIDHDDRKPLSRWLDSQRKYAVLEANKLTAGSRTQLSWKDRLRLRIVYAPLLNLIYCLVARRLILDGWPGIYYSLQRTYAELLLSLELLDRKLRTDTGQAEKEGEGRIEDLGLRIE